MLTTVEPMLAIPGDVPVESLAGTHAFDAKLDGVRMLAFWDGEQLNLRNRRQAHRSPTYPDLVESFWLPQSVVLDGEVVAPVGAFQDIARRDKAVKGHVARRLARQIPATFVAFDVLWHGGRDLRDLPYAARREVLTGISGVLRNDHWDITLASTDPALIQLIKDGGGEGVIAKRLSSRYTPGRSRNWLKFKNTTTITCIGTGYEPGSGSRADFGAMTLAVIDGADIRVVGRVGSGFTSREVSTLRQIFANVKTGVDLPIVEVECLGLTREGVLRQPVYKGLRTDLTMFDATASQLEGLTRS